MEAVKRLHTDFETGFIKALDFLQNQYPDTALTDLYIQLNQDKARLIFMDDEDHLLHEVNISDFIKNTDDDFVRKNIAKAFKTVTGKIKDKKAFKGINILSPLSVILVDESFTTMEEFQVTDNDQIILGEELLANWEKDLDDFMEKIIKDF